MSNWERNTRPFYPQCGYPDPKEEVLLSHNLAQGPATQDTLHINISKSQ